MPALVRQSDESSPFCVVANSRHRPRIISVWLLPPTRRKSDGGRWGRRAANEPSSSFRCARPPEQSQCSAVFLRPLHNDLDPRHRRPTVAGPECVLLHWERGKQIIIRQFFGDCTQNFLHMPKMVYWHYCIHSTFRCKPNKHLRFHQVWLLPRHTNLLRW